MNSRDGWHMVVPALEEAMAKGVEDHRVDRRIDTAEFRVAALEAELNTGRRESTADEARRGILWRMARMTGGFLLLIIGIIMLPLPGPGMLVIAAALAILSVDVAWADRLLRYMRKKTPGIPEDGRIPRSSIVVGATLFCASMALAVFFVY